MAYAQNDYVIVLPTQPAQIAGSSIVTVPIVWPSKNPADYTTYGLDFSQLARFGSLTSATASVINGLPTSPSVTLDGSSVLLTVHGGVVGVPIVVQITTMLADGSVFRRGGVIPVVDDLSNFGVNATFPVAPQAANVLSLTAIVGALPTTLPALPGILWLNGGVLSVS